MVYYSPVQIIITFKTPNFNKLSYSYSYIIAIQNMLHVHALFSSYLKIYF
jgi:hypothetical protein